MTSRTDRGIDMAIAAIRDAVNGTQRKLGAKILQTVVFATPFDTGRARGNWNVGLGEMDPSVDENNLDPTGAQTVSIGTALIQSASERSIQELHISNSLPYIVPLNDGWSDQAPAGFVEKAVQVAAKGL